MSAAEILAAAAAELDLAKADLAGARANLNLAAALLRRPARGRARWFRCHAKQVRRCVA